LIHINSAGSLNFATFELEKRKGRSRLFLRVGWAILYRSVRHLHRILMRSLTRTFRIRAAILVALAYAFCVLAPSAALAFSESPKAFHCLSELAGMGAPPQHEAAGHTHMDGASHHHDERGAPDHHSGMGDKGHSGSCCGLFCTTALSHDPGLTFGLAAPASPTLLAIAKSIIGHAPSPLHRPPIA
jgi:hypothetical protein